MLSKKTLNQEGQKLLVIPCVLQHPCIALKKQHTKKNKEEATEYTKFGQENEGKQRGTPGTDCQGMQAVPAESFYSTSQSSQK